MARIHHDHRAALAYTIRACPSHLTIAGNTVRANVSESEYTQETDGRATETVETVEVRVLREDVNADVRKLISAGIELISYQDRNWEIDTEVPIETHDHLVFFTMTACEDEFGY